MNRVAIIILNWNGISDTLDCLKSIQQQSYKNYRIIVVDNGSTDSSHEVLENYKNKNSKIDVIYNVHNFGFAGGVNTGIEYAMNDNFDYVALFNNDAIADNEWLKNLMLSTDNNIGIITGKFLLIDGKRIDSTGEQYSKWGLPFPRDRNKLTNLAAKTGFVFGATGGASLYSIQMLREIGLFDEDFFAYYEDTDISFRAQLAGWKVVYETKAIAYHKQGETSKKIPGFTVYQTFKNLPLLFIKNVPRGLLLSIGIRFYFAYLMMFLNAVKNGSGKYAVNGIIKSIVLTPKKVLERFDIQKSKIVPTSYIKSLLWPDLPPSQTGLRKLRKFFIGK